MHIEARKYGYRRLDVFTDEPFGGNPLAVFLDPGELSAAGMQKIAREMNLSETVFVSRTRTSPRDWRVRFFTPAIELPFAGHPTLGTAVALVLEGMVECRAGAATFTLHEPVGPVPVTVTRDEAGGLKAVFSAPSLPEFGPADVSLERLADMLGLAAVDVLSSRWRPRSVSCGVPFYIVAVRSLDAIRRVRLRRDLWESTLADHWAPHLYVVTPEVERPGSAIHARMFPPAMGVDEDPATGGAAAALSGFLTEAEAMSDGPRRWRIEQGFELGRPSVIELEADVEHGAVRAIRLGGSVVSMGEGALSLPNFY